MNGSRGRPRIPLLVALCFSLPHALFSSGTAAAPAASSPAHDAPAALVTIIIDDLGMAWTNGERALRLPGAVTFAILPFTRYSVRLANEARALGKEVIVHMPMENLHDKPLGEGGLTHLQDHAQFLARVECALDDVPGAVGISNHMGSYLTQQAAQMRWLMEPLRQRHLFFIDSRTTPLTLAADVARRNDVPEASRDVFLDNVLTFYDIDLQFQRLLALAGERGHAIAIGHPHDVTLAYLEMVLPLLAELDVRLVPASTMVDHTYTPLPDTLVAESSEGGVQSAGSR